MEEDKCQAQERDDNDENTKLDEKVSRLALKAAFLAKEKQIVLE